MRLRGRHALFPPEGEQEKGEKRELLRHSERRLAPGAGSSAVRIRAATVLLTVVLAAPRGAVSAGPPRRRASAGQGVRTTLPRLRRSTIIVCAAPVSSNG